MKILRIGIPFAIITIVFGTLYIAVEQSFRMSANDPQIAMAEDAARAFDRGASPQKIANLDPVDMSISLSPFIMVFDNSGNMLASTATLGGSVRTPPKGILLYTRTYGEDRVTWQPEVGTRVALVAVASNNGFVVAGRSLVQVEHRTGSLGMLALFGWLLSMSLWALYTYITRPRGLWSMLG